jgi:hypothetical protein
MTRQRAEILDDDRVTFNRIGPLSVGARLAVPREPERRQSRWGRGAERLQRKPAPAGIDVGVQGFKWAE